MTLTRAVVASALSAIAVASAVPAAADSDVFGTYAFTAEDGETATWTLTPCAGDPPGCVRVSETGNAKRAPWSGDAHWSVGSIILFVEQPDAILCADGSSVPGRNTYSWDGASMSGSASIITNGACDVESMALSIPFTLNRIGAAEAGPAPAPPPAAPAAPPAAAPGATAPAPQPAPAPVAPLAAESTAGPAEAPPTPPPPAS